MKDYMEGSQGNCPVCGSDNLTYGNVEDCDTGVCYPWTCDDCGSSGKECYSIEFDSHQDVEEFLDREKIKKAMQCLADNGIEKGECPVVLQALCYILLDKEIEPLLTEEDYED